jgi:hypothetical protein
MRVDLFASLYGSWKYTASFLANQVWIFFIKLEHKEKKYLFTFFHSYKHLKSLVSPFMKVAKTLKKKFECLFLHKKVVKLFWSNCCLKSNFPLLLFSKVYPLLDHFTECPKIHSLPLIWIPFGLSASMRFWTDFKIDIKTGVLSVKNC